MKMTSMQATVSVLSRLLNWPQAKLWILLGGLALSSCQTPDIPPQRAINIQQQWELEPGDQIGEHLVVGSLGDISIQLKHQSLRVPFPGKVEPSTIEQCVIYSTPEVPAYLFRFCGLQRPKFGPVKAGQKMGNGKQIQFATLRRQPDGTWIIVEPSTGVLERAISKHPGSDKTEPEQNEREQVKSPKIPADKTSIN
ncbi:hypothetical protein [Leptothoe sp. PORK10 BA2]|uniref:hypothetical protein n=1 Tax=Leptothoe sp. PORK10 BA2 TaxID=3110254 RepID=UPI002B208F1D|nr:hypothetical protein [Leptothoe sp. PORK10 BA2]MEA5466018.1 hypothetical protein [Leptothoe sp. PORK10 BA2]